MEMSLSASKLDAQVAAEQGREFARYVMRLHTAQPLLSDMGTLGRAANFSGRLVIILGVS